MKERLGGEGVKRANRHFTWRKVACAIGAVIEEVACGAGRKSPGAGWQPRVVRESSASIIETLRVSREVLHLPIMGAADAIGDCFERDRKLLACGNGGSAADAQHFVGELVGRFKRRDRQGLPALALTADSAIITACSNDMGYENVFARQVQALGKRGDLLVCIGVDGRSPSLVRACAQARAMGLTCVALLGSEGGELAAMANIAVLVPALDEHRVQEVQLLALHLICALVEERMVLGKSPAIENHGRLAIRAGVTT